MESNCNNCNAVNCVRSNMRRCDGQITGRNQIMSNRERMMQQRRREESKGPCRREERVEKQQREVRMEQRGRVERVTNPSGKEHRIHNRNVEVECVCQVTCEKDCHRHDDMEHLGCEFPVVMAYVPWQQWGDMYEAECGLMQGTIFKDLNFIFCGERC